MNHVGSTGDKRQLWVLSMVISEQAVANCANPTEFNGERRVLIFAPWCYGHHPTYIEHLLHYWRQSSHLGHLELLVMPEFLRQHQDVAAIATDQAAISIHLTTMTEAEQAKLYATTSGWARAIVQHQLIGSYAQKLKATHALILYFDSCQLPLVLGLPLPCDVSGIYFRPTFHYNQLAGVTSTVKEQLQQWRERLFLRQVLHHPQFKTLFCLDPFVVDVINRSHREQKAIYLPDPVMLATPNLNQVEALRTHFKLDPSRQVLLLFGRLDDGRKGVVQLLEAVQQLPTALCEKLCLMLVGFATPDGQATITAQVEQVRQGRPIQLISQYDYVPEADVAAYFQLADGVLAPYQRHVGSSGILLQAAAAGKPVLCSDYGLIGELTRRYQLGVVVDTTQPQQIAWGLTQLLTAPPDSLCDRGKMQAFVEQSNSDNFARIIFQTLHPSGC